MSNKIALPAGQHIEELSHALCAELATPYITSTGLKPDENYTATDLIVFGRAATGIESVAMWLRGDAALGLYGHNMGSDGLKAMADIFNCSVKRLLNNMTTCKVWPQEQHRGSQVSKWDDRETEVDPWAATKEDW